jgi:hypothetical protein
MSYTTWLMPRTSLMMRRTTILIALCQTAVRNRCRDARRIRALLNAPSSIVRDGPSALLRMRGWRAEKRKPMVPGPLPDTAGASRRANRGVCPASGRAFRLGGYA